MHITASVFINDDEPGLHADYKKWLEQLAPFDPSPEHYQHNRGDKKAVTDALIEHDRNELRGQMGGLDA